VTVPLAISESHSKDVCSDTLSAEAGLRAYAHVDANGFLKRSSYDKGGALIGPGGVMEALRQLEASTASATVFEHWPIHSEWFEHPYPFQNLH